MLAYHRLLINQVLEKSPRLSIWHIMVPLIAQAHPCRLSPGRSIVDRGAGRSAEIAGMRSLLGARHSSGASWVVATPRKSATGVARSQQRGTRSCASTACTSAVGTSKAGGGSPNRSVNPAHLIEQASPTRVILSAAKDLMLVASGDEVLRCAQDDNELNCGSGALNPAGSDGTLVRTPMDGSGGSPNRGVNPAHFIMGIAGPNGIDLRSIPCEARITIMSGPGGPRSIDLKCESGALIPTGLAHGAFGSTKARTVRNGFARGDGGQT
jgi:hypothetical protein